MIAFAATALDRLDAIVDEYIDARDLCAKQQEHLRRHVRSFRTWQEGRAAGPLDTTALNAWLAEIAASRAPSTVNNYRQSILSLVRFATPDDEPLPRADRIRRQKEPDAIKAAFTRGEIRTLLAAAREYQPTSVLVLGKGKAFREKPRFMPDGTRWSLWWEAFTRAGYDSGQYLSDLRRLRWRELRRDGSATLVRHKTGRFIAFKLRPRTVEACKLLGDDELVLPWRWNLGAYFCREWNKFVAFAGLRPLTAKSLRRSAITYTYIEQGPEAARMLAGHASFATTAKHYIDWSIAERPAVQPPPL